MRAALPAAAHQGGGGRAAGVGGHPVVDALPGHPEQVGDVGRRPRAIEFQDGQGAAQAAGIPGRLEVASKASRSACRVRNFAATTAVEQLPNRTHTTLGGCPNSRTRCWKSLSFETITIPWVAA